MRTLLAWMNAHFLNERTGLWGSLDTGQPRELSRAVQGGCHLWLLYFYDRLLSDRKEETSIRIISGSCSLRARRNASAWRPLVAFASSNSRLLKTEFNDWTRVESFATIRSEAGIGGFLSIGIWKR